MGSKKQIHFCVHPIISFLNFYSVNNVQIHNMTQPENTERGSWNQGTIALVLQNDQMDQRVETDLRKCI